MWAMLAGASLLALVPRKERTLFVVLLQELGAGGEASPGDDALRDALQAPALARSFVIVAHPVPRAGGSLREALRSRLRYRLST